MQHILVALVEDKPGVLNRITSLFRRRAFNIDTLTVGQTERPGISRMTIVVQGEDIQIERLTAYLYKLVNVIKVEDIRRTTNVTRDLAMIKVQATPENRTHIMQTVDVFRARIVDVTNDSFIVEVTGDLTKIDGLLEVLKPFGIIEMVRTGAVSMARGSAPTMTFNGNGKDSKPVQVLNRA
jgi:acetolactate synthase-1/3 small subunit